MFLFDFFTFSANLNHLRMHCMLMERVELLNVHSSIA